MPPKPSTSPAIRSASIIWSHRVALLLLLATLFAYEGWNISWRGQGIEALLLAWSWLSALWLFLSFRRQLHRRDKWYFGLVTLFPFVPIVGWLPCAMVLLPNHVLYKNAQLSIRDQNQGLLDLRRVALVRPLGLLFERLTFYSDDWPTRQVSKERYNFDSTYSPSFNEQLPPAIRVDSIHLAAFHPATGQQALFYAQGHTYEAHFAATNSLHPL